MGKFWSDYDNAYLLPLGGMPSNEDSIQMQACILYVEVKKHLEAETMTV